MRGRKHKQYSKDQTSNTLKEYYKTHRDSALIYELKTCIYCNYTGKKNIISRRHNEKCKKKGISTL